MSSCSLGCQYMASSFLERHTVLLSCTLDAGSINRLTQRCWLVSAVTGAAVPQKEMTIDEEWTILMATDPVFAAMVAELKQRV